jgi:hypothetical protein
MVHSQNVNLLLVDDSVDDSIRSKDNLADFGTRVFGDRASRLRNVLKPIDRVKESSNDDASEVWRVDFDEGVDRREIIWRALSPGERDHARKRSSPQALKPSNPQAPKPSSPQALKPSSPQALKPSSPQALKPSSPQALNPSSPQPLNAPSTASIVFFASPNSIRVLSL